MRTVKSNFWQVGIVLTAAAAMLFASCKDDENTDNNPNEPENEIAIYDDLAVFQQAICRLDSAGQLVRYNIGEVLYDNEPQHLYIGVDSIGEAEAYFRSWIAPDVEIAVITPSLHDLSAALTDTLGNPQGTIYFNAGSGSIVAEITASGDAQLEYVDKITFLQNSAWPHNSAAKVWHKGDIRTFTITGECGDALNSRDKALNFVLVREAGNGEKPMWCAITNDTYPICGTFRWEYDNAKRMTTSAYCPNMDKAKKIATMLQKDWDFFVGKFDEAGSGKLSSTESYWTNSQHWNSYLMKYQDVIIYANSYTHGVRTSVNLTHPAEYLPFLFVIDWLNDGEILYTVNESNKVYHTAQSAANIFDGNSETKWCTPDWGKETSEVSGKDCWWVEFESNTTITPTGYQMVTGDDTEEYPGRNPRIWTIYGKKNYRDKWTVIANCDNTNSAVLQMTPANYWTGNWAINGTTGEYQYFRLEMYENAGWDGEHNFQISEFKFKY